MTEGYPIITPVASFGLLEDLDKLYGNLIYLKLLVCLAHAADLQDSGRIAGVGLTRTHLIGQRPAYYCPKQAYFASALTL